MIQAGAEGKPSILIVDDEVDVLQSLVDLLRRDYRVFATTDVDEALAAMRTQNFAVIVADQRMPRQTGVELLSKAAIIGPETGRILLTAYSDIEAVIEAVNKGGISHYMTKPWDPPVLLEVLRQAAMQNGMEMENKRLINQLAEASGSLERASTRRSELEVMHSSLTQDNERLKAALDTLQNSHWHINKIREVLPFCMECGKVKTGETTWKEATRFLEENSSFLSHGYCPECAAIVQERLFGFAKRMPEEKP